MDWIKLKRTGRGGGGAHGAVATRLALAVSIAVSIAMSGCSQLTDSQRTTGGDLAAVGGGLDLDRHATRGHDQAPVSDTGNGLPPAGGRATPLHFWHQTAAAEPVARRHTGHEEREEVESGAGANATSTQQLSYHGNAVQTSPRIYLVLWGNWSAGDPFGVANRLHYFYDGVGGSSLGSVLKQYGGSAGAFSNPRAQYRGYLFDTSPVPTRPTAQDVANAAARAAVKMGDISYNAQYVIATPYGILDQKSIAKSWCAWHDSASVVGYSGWLTYTSMPYIPYEDDLGRGCGRDTVNVAGRLDGVTILASHEWAETVNDPALNAWYDAVGDENADKCQWLNLANRVLANGLSFPVMPSWSNYYRANYGNGCLFSSS